MSNTLIVIALIVGAFVVTYFVGEWLTRDRFSSRSESGKKSG